MKAVVVKITSTVVADLCKTTGDRCIFMNIKGVPEDAKFVGAYFDHDINIFTVRFVHESFEDIPAGEPLPIITATHTKYYV